MKRTVTTRSWSTLLFIAVAALTLCMTMGATQALAQISTTGNNFTMIDGSAGLVGGTNDVAFTWDGTTKTAVAASGQVSNATLSSTCTFFGLTWSAHDLAIYGPGTYTVYDGCASGSPGCGTGNAVAFTVGATELAAHMLFDWGASANIDVIDIWAPNAVFGPSPMWTGICGTGNASQAWNWMSKDWDGDGSNGAGMTDGPFQGFNANFNVMSPPCTTNCYDGNPCTDDACNTATGVCEYTNNTAVCNDGLICTDNDVCSAGACTGTAVVCSQPIACNEIVGCDECGDAATRCDDGNPCTDVDCRPADGVCLYTPITAPCSDGNACTSSDTCVAGTCGGTAVVCNDNNVCTTDSCNTATGCVYANNTLPCGSGGTCAGGVCVEGPVGEKCIGSEYEILPVDTIGNNFTMIDGTGALVGGTNDVRFTWDGTKKTSVAVSGQVPNATITSSCPFFGSTWDAHDVTIYAPGTYTIYDGCAANSPGCGTGNAVSFTVAEGELGAHMLFDWTTSLNIDVVNVWAPTLAFGPSPMWTGACGENDAAKVWDWMAKDSDGDGFNGTGMTDGPFMDFNANFSVMGTDPSVDTTGNNFTMIDGTGALVGGTNDVRFTWSGSRKIKVCDLAGGQVPNATITSSCPFFGSTWDAHDVTIYAPGTYTIYDGCTANYPSCGTGNAVTFTVAEGELAAHMLFDWTTSSNIDVIDVWAPGLAFGPSPMWTGACGEGDATQVWDWMAKDSDGDGFNGTGMTDGPFMDFNANFSVMAPSVSNQPPAVPVLTLPGNLASGLGTTVEFRWTKVCDPDGDDVTYAITYCTDANLTGCDPITVAKLPSELCTPATASSTGIFFAGGAGLLLMGMMFIGGISSRKRMVVLLLLALAITGGSIVACSNDDTTSETNLPINEMSYTAEGLTPASTYYWKVTASDGKGGGTSSSAVQTFTTQ